MGEERVLKPKDVVKALRLSLNDEEQEQVAEQPDAMSAVAKALEILSEFMDNPTDLLLSSGIPESLIKPQA